MAISFDGATKRIILPASTVQLDVARELYSFAKETWLTDPDLARLRFPFRTTGGDPLGGALTAGANFFLQNQAGQDWRIRPQEADHELTFVGNLYAEDPTLPITVTTLGDHTVSLFFERSSLTQQVATGSGVTQQDKTDIEALVAAGSVGTRLDSLTAIEPGAFTLPETMRLLAAVLAGDIERQAGGVFRLKKVGDPSRVRVEGTVDDAGNRTVTLIDAEV